MTISDRIKVDKYIGWAWFGRELAVKVADISSVSVVLLDGRNGRHALTVQVKSEPYSHRVFEGTRLECRNRFHSFWRQM